MFYSSNSSSVNKTDLIKYLPLTQEYLSKTINLINEIYFKEEHISTLLGLDKSLEDIKELSEKFVMHLINHEISFVAVEQATENVIGCQINTLRIKSDGKPSSYSYCIDIKNPIAKAYIDINNQLDEAAHPFQLLNTNCYIEPIIAVVVSKYRQTGVMKRLCTVTDQMAVRFSKGENVKVPLNGNPSSISLWNPLPTGLIVYSTVIATRKAVEKFGFKKIYEFDLHKLNYFQSQSCNVLKVDVLFKTISDNKNV